MVNISSKEICTPFLRGLIDIAYFGKDIAYFGKDAAYYGKDIVYETISDDDNPQIIDEHITYIESEVNIESHIIKKESEIRRPRPMPKALPKSTIVNPSSPKTYVKPKIEKELPKEDECKKEKVLTKEDEYKREFPSLDHKKEDHKPSYQKYDIPNNEGNGFKRDGIELMRYDGVKIFVPMISKYLINMFIQKVCEYYRIREESLLDQYKNKYFPYNKLKAVFEVFKRNCVSQKIINEIIEELDYEY
jgi:hypothetical protein